MYQLSVSEIDRDMDHRAGAVLEEYQVAAVRSRIIVAAFGGILELDVSELCVEDTRHAVVRPRRRTDRPEIHSRAVAGLHHQSGLVYPVARRSRSALDIAVAHVLSGSLYQGLNVIRLRAGAVHKHRRYIIAVSVFAYRIADLHIFGRILVSPHAGYGEGRARICLRGVVLRYHEPPVRCPVPPVVREGEGHRRYSGSLRESYRLLGDPLSSALHLKIGLSGLRRTHLDRQAVCFTGDQSLRGREARYSCRSPLYDRLLAHHIGFPADRAVRAVVIARDHIEEILVVLDKAGHRLRGSFHPDRSIPVGPVIGAVQVIAVGILR